MSSRADDSAIETVRHAAMVSARECLKTIAESGEFVFEGKRYSVSAA